MTIIPDPDNQTPDNQTPEDQTPGSATPDPAAHRNRRDDDRPTPTWVAAGAAVATTAVLTALVTVGVTGADPGTPTPAEQAIPSSTGSPAPSSDDEASSEADAMSSVDAAGDLASATSVDTAASADTTAERVESAPPEVVASPAPSPGTGALDGAWSTVGADIVDGDGDPVRIRGVNWFGFETATGAPHGLWSRDLDVMLDQIADLGFNTIRLPFAAAMLDNTQPVQGINEQENPDLRGLTSIELMDVFIERAGLRGLGIVLDRHALGFDNRHHLWFDDQFPHERLADDWRFMAERYGDVANVIGADLYNEPHDEACWGCGDETVDWKLAAEEAADALHEVDPDWLVFVEGVEEPDGASCDGPDASDACIWWGGNLSEAIDEPIELAVPNKVVYSPHEYATSVFRQSWFDDASFPANLPDIWDRFWGDIEITDTAPVMVGEFGTTLDADVDRVWLETLLAYMDDNGIGFTFWTFNPNSGDTGGILEDDWETVDTDKMSFLEPYLVGPFEPVS